jgi:RNA polymerase primary sigma factor
VAAQDTTIAVPGEVRKWAYHHHTHPDLTIQQIADHFEVKPRRIKDALGAAAVVATLDVTQEDSFPLQVQDLQADDPEERALGAVMHELVGELLGTLTDDERQVVEMKFGLNGFGGREHTPKEIAEVTGSTHNAVNRILSNALHTLRDAA